MNGDIKELIIINNKSKAFKSNKTKWYTKNKNKNKNNKVLLAKGNKRVIMTKNDLSPRYKRVATSLNSLCKTKNTTIKNEFCIPLRIKSEGRKRDLMRGKINLELLKIAKEELKKEIGIVMETELNGLKEKIIGQEVLNKIVFLFDNDVTDVIYQCEKMAILDFNKAIQKNIKTIDLLIDVEYEEGGSIMGVDETSKKIIRLLDEEIIEENWYIVMARNPNILNEINKIKVIWEKSIKKIEYKSNRINAMNKIREERRKNIREQEKIIYDEVEKRVFHRLVEVSQNIIISDNKITEETINDRYRKQLAIDIEEILKLKKVEINEVMSKLNEQGKKQRAEVSEEYVSRITKNVCKIIIERIIKCNWYYGLIRKWGRIKRKGSSICRPNGNNVYMKKRKINKYDVLEPRMESGSGDKACEDKKKKRKRWNNIINSNCEASLKEKKRRRTTTEDIRVFFGTEDSH